MRPCGCSRASATQCGTRSSLTWAVAADPRRLHNPTIRGLPSPGSGPRRKHVTGLLVRAQSKQCSRDYLAAREEEALIPRWHVVTAFSSPPCCLCPRGRAPTGAAKLRVGARPAAIGASSRPMSWQPGWSGDSLAGRLLVQCRSPQGRLPGWMCSRTTRQPTLRGEQTRQLPPRVGGRCTQQPAAVHPYSSESASSPARCTPQAPSGLVGVDAYERFAASRRLALLSSSRRDRPSW